MSRIYLETFGQGPAIVLLHGWAMHSGIWQSFAQQLAENYQVTLLDLPGHGYSEAVQPFDLPTIVHTIIEALPPQPRIWLGWSLGAEIALAISRYYPERVQQLLLVAGTPCFMSQPDWPGMSKTVLDSFALKLQQNPEATLLHFLALQVAGQADLKTVLPDLKKLLAARPLPQPIALTEGLSILQETDLRDQFADFNKKISVLLGRLDALVPAKVAMAMQSLRSDCSITVLEKASHVPFLSHPQAVLTWIKQQVEV